MELRAVVAVILFAVARSILGVDVKGIPLLDSPGSIGHGSTRMIAVDARYKVYERIWLHTSQFYAILGPSTTGAYLEEGLSVNNALWPLPVTNVTHTVANLPQLWLPGATLLLDFPFPSQSDNLGHWAEMVLPVYSVLREGDWAGQLGVEPIISQVVLTNMKVAAMPDWFQHTLEVALQPGTAPGQSLRLLDTDDLKPHSSQGYVAFERMLLVRDRYTHPDRLSGFTTTDHGDAWRHQGCGRYVGPVGPGFATPQHAADFRAAMFRKFNWSLPEEGPGLGEDRLPHRMTLMTMDSGDAVVNEEEVLDALWGVEEAVGWQVRPVTLAPTTNLLAHLVVAASTGVLIARHSALLANAVFLPPGALVVELLPYNWEWRNVSQLYSNITASTGVLHHIAWRAGGPHQVQYAQPNHIRYTNWTAEECGSRECMMVHRQAGVVADARWIKERLLRYIPLLEQRAAVGQIAEPWPSI